MGTVGFPSLNSDCLNTIFPYVVGNSIHLTASLSTVCKTWHTHLQSDHVWKPILEYHVTNSAEISPALSCREKVMSFFVDNGKELQELFEKYECKANAKHVLDKNIDNTQLFRQMFDKQQWEPMALCLLYKPTIDANKIAHSLFDATSPQGPLRSGDPAIAFCFQLLIKCHYDLKKFHNDKFQKSQNHSTSAVNALYEITCRILHRNVKGFELKDYLRSGLDLRPYDQQSSILAEVLDGAFHVYHENGSYSSASMESYPEVAFSNQKLIKLKAEGKFTEEEMRQLIRDIVFESGIDHRGDREYRSLFGQAMSVRPIEMLESYAEEERLPKKNVFKDVLTEYREAEGKKSMKFGQS